MTELTLPHKRPEVEDPLLWDLHNLQIRLEIQQGWVDRTLEQIDEVKEKLDLKGVEYDGMF